jgi:glutamate 5-kinase
MKRIVIKIGTNLLTQHDARLDRNNLDQLISQISKLKNDLSLDIIIVSSGAIACGSQLLNDEVNTVADNQASASIGQILLMSEYRSLFKEHNINIGQILLTKAELTHKKQQVNIKNTIDTLFNHDIIPIVNANDSVSTLQIESGDNDEIAALLATLIQADTLIILTNTNGLYSDNPTDNESATLIKTVPTLSKEMLIAAKGPENEKSRGGMKSKVIAAELARALGVNVYIANGREKRTLYDIANNKPVGTHFPKQKGV